MKVSHRIRCHLIVLLVMVHSSTAAKPPAADFTKCGEKNMICMGHEKSCITDDETKDEYILMKKVTKIIKSCVRYFIIEAKTRKQVAIEIRDDTVAKNQGITFFSGHNEKIFDCKDNKVSLTSTKVSLSPIDTTSEKVYCKFLISIADNNADTISNFLSEAANKPVRVGPTLSNTVPISGLSVGDLEYPCEWKGRMFDHNPDNEETEEYHALETTSGEGKSCPHGYFNWYMKYEMNSRGKWVKINNFTCYEGKIATTMKEDDTRQRIDPDFQNDRTKCSRIRCAACTCPFCNATDLTTPKFIPSDGEKCNVIKCTNTGAKMLLSTQSGKGVHLKDSLTCTVKGTVAEDYKTTWGDYDKIEGVKCISEVRCTEINPVESVCKEAEVPLDYECVNTTLKDDGADVCDTDQTNISYTPKGGNPRRLPTFKCNVTTGRWDSTEQIGPGSNVVCLRPKTKSDLKVSQSSVLGGTIIAIICGVACLVIIIIVVVIYCLRRHFNKKGNREEMKSVSVTGKNDKKSKRNKDKKGKSSSSATSEVISAPAPPPCPDSLVFHVEPDSPVPKVGAPLSSGGNSLVGPDTGKPDKPAELIDIKLESEGKKSEEKSKAGETSVANTVTGTSFDKSNVGPVSKKEESKTDVTDTKKTGKNGESARSDTGRTGTKDGTKKRRKYKDKNGKVQLDKNGKGFTDDDDYDIDEGAKPVSHVDKNKKPYTPAIDPRKKMINVTVTEDEDGRIKPKNAGKSPIF